MEFLEKKGIYKQIGESICEMILQGEYTNAEKIPSVREMAARLEVNQNTIMRTYGELLREGVLLNRRGIGYFVSEDAESIIRLDRKHQFLSKVVPEFIKQVKLLSPTKEELEPIFNLISSIK